MWIPNVLMMITINCAVIGMGSTEISQNNPVLGHFLMLLHVFRMKSKTCVLHCVLLQASMILLNPTEKIANIDANDLVMMIYYFFKYITEQRKIIARFLLLYTCYYHDISEESRRGWKQRAKDCILWMFGLNEKFSAN